MSLEIAFARIKAAKESGSKVLNLSYLGLAGIPPRISKLTHLTHLYLDHNNLESIDELVELNQLELLSLDNNQLKEIPIFLPSLDVQIFLNKEVAQPVQLIHLCITLTQLLIEHLTQTLANDQALANTQVLSKTLDRFLLIDFSLDQNLPLIINTSIDCAEALVNSLPQVDFLGRTLTQDLVLVQDQELARALARDIALALTLADALNRALTDTKSRADALDRAIALAQILELNLDRDLAQARALDQALDRNLTRNLTPGFHLYPSYNLLSGIYLKDNPIEAPPPPEIMAKGKHAITAFLKEFVEKAHLNEVKVILVGEGASGKTSLVKRLLGKKFDRKEPQTHGIKILNQRFSDKEENFIVNFWDFGGQEIMHATHQFFLTKRCLYILVLDSRKDEKAEYWLNYIQSFGGEAPVVIVLNKYDQNPSFDVNRKFLNKKYSNILSYHKISCKTSKGIDSLNNDLMNYLWDLELRNTPYPKGWAKVKQQLESMKEDYIGYGEYQAICEKNYVNNPTSQKVLLALLNDLGVIFNYEQLRLLDTQVLNPLWLTNSVYRIINSPIVAEAKGRFRINHLEAIINDERYYKENPDHWKNIFQFWKPEQKMQKVPEAKFLFIVSMMKQFEILYEVEEFEYIIPGLLADGEDIYEFGPTDSTLEFTIEYEDFLPTAIIPRLMVKLNKYIYNQQVWKTGMVLEEKLLFNSIANIVLDKESRKINIEIKGARNRDFLTVIRETIKEINASYQGIETKELVPLPDLHKGEQLPVDYEELLGLEELGTEMFTSGKLRRAYPVVDLLNGIEKPERRKDHGPCHIFISYSHEDVKHKERLLKHLMPLVRLNKATLWHDGTIDAGGEWEQEIFDNLAKAQIVLCLISADFIASDFCYTQELKQALAAHHNGTQTVIPIRIKEALWDNLDIAKLQGLPANRWMRDIEDDEIWTEIAKGIEVAINKLKHRA